MRYILNLKKNEKVSLSIIFTAKKNKIPYSSEISPLNDWLKDIAGYSQWIELLGR